MLKRFLSSELVKGATILFVMMNIFNLLNFLFQFIMARLLGPAGYGTLAVLISMIYVYGVPTEAIQNIVSRHTSKFNLKKEYGKIKFFMFRSLKKSFVIAGLIFIVATIFSIFLTRFLKIDFWLIFITNLFIFLAFFNPILKGVLQGRKKFKLLGMSLILDAGLKLIFSIFLVLIGMKVFGAILGILLGVFGGLIFGLYFNREIVHAEKKEASFKKIYSESTPYFISMLVILLVLSLDIILAKRFFSPEVTGQYAVLSMLGKVIFLGTIAISKAMFPLTSENHENKKSSKKLLEKSFIIVLGISVVIIIAYFLFPELIVSISYGSQYLDVAPLIVYSGIALSFLSLSNLLLVYGLSTNKLKKSYYLFIFLIVEIVLFSLFHDTLLEYILAFMASNIIMFIGSFFFIKKE